MKYMYRFDYVFSYWIFLWYLLYEFKWITYNPKLAILLGLIENAFLLGIMIYFKNSFFYIFLFCLVNLFLKVIPFWRLRNTTYQWKDAYAMMVYFMIFMLWIYLNKQSFTKYAYERYKKLKNNKPAFPFSQFVDKLLH